MKTKKPAGEKLTIGLDLGDRRHYACVLDASGEILAEEAIVNTPEVLTAWSARYPGATYVMETGTHSPWVSRLLNAQGHSVIVANAGKLRAISQSQTKSDREDAQMLARLAGVAIALPQENDLSRCFARARSWTASVAPARDHESTHHPPPTRGCLPALPPGAAARHQRIAPIGLLALPFDCGVRESATTTHAIPSCCSRR